MLKPLSLIYLVFLIIAGAAHAQTPAVTEQGVEVILYNDGTWDYAYLEDSLAAHKDLPTNPELFEKPANSTFAIKSEILDLNFYLNPKDWRFEKSPEGDASEFDLEFKKGDVYGMIINEQIEIPLTSLKNIALINAREVSSDIRITHEEYRMVNGLKVMHLEMEGTIQGIEFAYFGYYYSDTSGTTQYITYTSRNLMEKYRPYCEGLLNGLIKS